MKLNQTNCTTWSSRKKGNGKGEKYRKEGGSSSNTSENIAAKLATIVASQWEAPLMKNGSSNEWRHDGRTRMRGAIKFGLIKLQLKRRRKKYKNKQEQQRKNDQTSTLNCLPSKKNRETERRKESDLGEWLAVTVPVSVTEEIRAVAATCQNLTLPRWLTAPPLSSPQNKKNKVKQTKENKNKAGRERKRANTRLHKTQLPYR